MSKFILNIQDKFYNYRNDEDYLKKVLKEGANKARKLASKKMDEVRKTIGLKL